MSEQASYVSPSCLPGHEFLSHACKLLVKHNMLLLFALTVSVLAGPLPHGKELYRGYRQPGRSMRTLKTKGVQDEEPLPKLIRGAVQSCSFFQEHEIFREEGAEQGHHRELGLNTRQYRTPGGAVFRDHRASRASSWRKHLLDEDKLLEVKHFFSWPLQSYSKNGPVWSPEDQAHKNCRRRQVASFQHVGCCSAVLPHPSSCILIH